MFLAIDHFGGQICTLIDSVATNVDRHNEKSLPASSESAVSVNQPSNCHVGACLFIQLVGSESLAVLEDGRNLISSYDFA